MSWKSRKQRIVALSSCESEYITLADAAKEAMWLILLLNFYNNKKIVNIDNQPVTIFEDNQSTIKIANNPIMGDRTKHFEVRYHKIREYIDAKKIKLEYCPTADQTADIFTKALGKVKHAKFTRALGLID